MAVTRVITYTIWLVEGREPSDKEWYLYEIFRSRALARHWIKGNVPANTRFIIRKVEVE